MFESDNFKNFQTKTSKKWTKIEIIQFFKVTPWQGKDAKGVKAIIDKRKGGFWEISINRWERGKLGKEGRIIRKKQ